MIEALEPGVSHVEFRYCWTGSGREPVPLVLSDGHRLMGEPIPMGGIWRYYYVHFGRTLAAGDRVTVRIQQELYDDEGTFQPFLAKTISEPIDALTLRAILPYHPTDVKLAEYRDDTAVRSQTGTFDGHVQEVRWEVRSPRLGNRFAIEWTVPGSTPNTRG